MARHHDGAARARTAMLFCGSDASRDPPAQSSARAWIWRHDRDLRRSCHAAADTLAPDPGLKHLGRTRSQQGERTDVHGMWLRQR